MVLLCRMAQTKATVQKIQDEKYEMSKPLARYADDEDLEKMLKERLRDGDPILTFTKKKREERKDLSVKVKKGCIFKNVFLLITCHFVHR